MCEFKSDEHKMVTTDVRRIARDVLVSNPLSAIHEDADAITRTYLANVGSQYRYGLSEPFAMYWQPDPAHYYNDYHVVSEAQYNRVLAEVSKQSDRIRKLLKLGS